jgi:phosphonate transport system substrate-binding protein
MRLTPICIIISCLIVQSVSLSAIGQENTKQTSSVSRASRAKSSSTPREKLVVAMPRTYAKTETMSLWGDYFSHLSRCANVDLQNAAGESLSSSYNVDVMAEKDLIEAIKSGKAQLAQVNPGLVAQLVSSGYPSPFAVPGNKATGVKNSYKLILITRIDSGIDKPTDLVGKKIAHTTPTSPRALFPAIGLTPEKDYEVTFSNGHERSVMGVLNGFWPAAAVASDLYQRMIVKSEIRGSAFRTLWESPPFMTESWMMSKEINPEVQTRIRKCSLNYSFSPNLRKLLPNNDTLLPVNFERDFSTVMEVYNKNQKK